MSTTQLPAPELSAWRGSALNVASGSAEPDRRAVDDDLGRRRAAPPRARRARSASATARSGVRFQTATSAAPARTSAQTAARAAPPAPSTSARPAGADPSVCASAAISPGASVLSAWMAPSRSNVSVLAAPISRAASRRLVGERERGLLVRDRHVDAAEAGRGQRPHGLGEQLRRQRQLQVAPVGQARPPRAPRCASRASASGRPASRRRPRQGHCQGSREAWYFATSRWNCASVEENACSPESPGLRT